MSYENILVDRPAEGVGRVRLNRPKVLNALNSALMDEVNQAMSAFESDAGIGAMILTGSDKAFAAGADIRELDGLSAVDILKGQTLVERFNINAIGKPIIAAVSGFALGGGCELAMLCDIIVASESAVFGQPEINLGILPGAGGTQRLTRILGKSLAMEVILADRRLSAQEALQHGLASRVAPLDLYMEVAIDIAGKVGQRSQVAVRLAKDAINQAYESTLSAGLDYERANFMVAFASEDKAEGTRAFVEKRKAQWKHR